MAKMMDLLHCLEQSPTAKSNFSAAARVCSKKMSINYGPIEKCTNSTEGNRLQHQMAVATNKLNPRHQYVPWIVVNQVP